VLIAIKKSIITYDIGGVFRFVTGWDGERGWSCVLRRVISHIKRLWLHDCKEYELKMSGVKVYTYIFDKLLFGRSTGVGV